MSDNKDSLNRNDVYARHYYYYYYFGQKGLLKPCHYSKLTFNNLCLKRLNFRRAVMSPLPSLNKRCPLLARSPCLMLRLTWHQTTVLMAVHSNLCLQTPSGDQLPCLLCVMTIPTTNKPGTTRTALAVAVGAAVDKNSRQSWTVREHLVMACGTLHTRRSSRLHPNRVGWGFTLPSLTRGHAQDLSGHQPVEPTVHHPHPPSLGQTTNHCPDLPQWWHNPQLMTLLFPHGHLNKGALARRAAVSPCQQDGQRMSRLNGVPVLICHSHFPVMLVYPHTLGRRFSIRRVIHLAWWRGRTGRKRGEFVRQVLM